MRFPASLPARARVLLPPSRRPATTRRGPGQLGGERGLVGTAEFWERRNSGRGWGGAGFLQLRVC